MARVHVRPVLAAACGCLLALHAHGQDSASAPLVLTAARSLVYPAAAPGGHDTADVQPLTLATAYSLALENDPTFRAARASAAAREERLPQARAQLMPNISLTGSWLHNDLSRTSPSLIGPIHSGGQYDSFNASVVIRQPLLRPFQWADVRQARAQVAEAHSVLAFQTQDLAVRTADAYLQVLSAQGQLRLIAARKANYATTLAAARRRFEAGAGTRTDIDEAQARIDLAIAQELEARQAFDYARQQLEAIIGERARAIAPLGSAAFPLAMPDPPRPEAWVELALAGSPEVHVMQSRVEIAKREVDKARAGHLATLDVVAQVTRADSDNPLNLNRRYEQRMIGLQLNVPLFAGGYTQSQLRQALAALSQAEDSLEAMRRDVALRVVKEYRGVSEGVLKVRARQQAVRSAETALDSARKSFQAGARTLPDVLSAQEQLAQAERDLAQARYDYLVSRIRLRALTGRADHDAMDEAGALLSVSN